jgi:WS/DGAT/MGAT family acyltransferase
MAPKELDRRMGNTDALMLRLERSAMLRSTIVQVALLDQLPDHARMRAKVLRGIDQIPRFRQVPESSAIPGMPPTWVDARDFDVDYHLRFYRLADDGTAHGGGDLRALLNEAAHIGMQSFDMARPLWESHVIGGLQDDRAATVNKIHHAMGDGVSLLDIILLFVDIERDPAAPLVDEEAYVPQLASWLARASENVRADARTIIRSTVAAPGDIARLARDPLGSARSLLALSRSLARLASPGSGPLSPIMQGRSLGAHYDTLVEPLGELKAAAKRVGGKLNTALLAGVAGGIGRYHEHHGTTAPAVRCAMPVSTRGAADDSLGNQFSPARFRLPVDVDDPARRMEITRDLSAEQREESALSLTGPAARVLNAVPAAVVTPAFEYVMRGIDVIVSSVPGASIQLYVAGAQSLGNYGFSPRAGAAVNITVISHLDELDIAVNTDPEAVPDPDVFMSCLRDGFDEVCKLA